MTKVEKQYVATVGISFGKPNPEVKVKAGEMIPDGVVPATIEDLLMDGAIKEAEEAEPDGIAR